MLEKDKPSPLCIACLSVSYSACTIHQNAILNTNRRKVEEVILYSSGGMPAGMSL
jgi:hypothetical protein